MNCRHCQTKLKLNMVDLGSSPISNLYLTKNTLLMPEKLYPLRVLVCEHCWLAQTEDFTDRTQLFDDEYPYFSSYSSSWLLHCKQYVDIMIERFNLNSHSYVVEIAANDGYLLQYVKARHIACCGIEPTASTAAAARAKGIDMIEDFFGENLAEKMIKQSKAADIIIANNVLAHVPQINDFVTGIALLLKPQGVATFEFPHLLKLIEQTQFDTIYHEHFSYLSITAVNEIFLANGLTIFDVEELSTHGGSLRVFAMRTDTAQHSISENVIAILRREERMGVKSMEFYADFQQKINKIKNDFLYFLLETKRDKKKVAAYGAAAKGNTFLNYAGVKSDLISFVVDRNPAKQGKYMPGSRIPIMNQTYLDEVKPDYLVILPWNLKDEIMTQLEYIKAWKGKFVIAVPQLEVIT